MVSSIWWMEIEHSQGEAHNNLHITGRPSHLSVDLFWFLSQNSKQVDLCLFGLIDNCLNSDQLFISMKGSSLSKLKILVKIANKLLVFLHYSQNPVIFSAQGYPPLNGCHLCTCAWRTQVGWTGYDSLKWLPAGCLAHPGGPTLPSHTDNPINEFVCGRLGRLLSNLHQPKTNMQILK